MQRDGIRISNDKELAAAVSEFLDGIVLYVVISPPVRESAEMLYNTCMQGEAAKAYLDLQLAKRDVVSNRLMDSEELLDKGYRDLASIDERMLKTVNSKPVACKDYYECA